MLKRLPSFQAPDSVEAEQRFDLREIINFLWRRWKFIAGVFALVLIIGGVYLSRQVPVYTAMAQILLDPHKDKTVGQDDILSDFALDLPAVESQMAIIRSTVLLRRVVDTQRLVNDPLLGATAGGGAWNLITAIKAMVTGPASPEPRQELPGTTPQSVPAETMATVENLKSGLIVTRSGQAYVLAISFTSPDPAQAARIANAVADAYVVDKLDARFEAAKRASGWLNDRLEELRKQLRESEQAVAQFKTDNALVQAAPGASLNQEQLAQLNSRLIEARAQLAEKKARLDLLLSVKARSGSLSGLPEVAASGAIGDLRKQLNDISRQEADLVARYSDKHPSVVNIRAQRHDIERAIAAEIERIETGIKNEYELANSRAASAERTLREATGQNDLDDTKRITLRELERTAAVNKTLFESFLQRARVTEEQSSFEARDARVLSPALPPGFPSAPKKTQVMVIAAFLGLMAGVGAAYTLELLNAGFTTPREVEELLQLPLLASVSRMEQRDLTVDGVAIPIPLYPLAKPLSRYSEAIRGLRSGVQMTDVDDPPKVLQVTSTLPGEGKTTLALSIATSAAQSGLRVLLIDADMRHPSSSRFFKLDKEPGLVEYLVGGAKLEDVVRFQENARYWVLAAGGKTQNPLDLLSSDRFKTLMAQFRASFDLVLVDTPPIGPVIDPTMVAQIVDKVIFVVRWAATAREVVQRATQQIAGDKKLAGIVFNYVNDAQAKKYGKYAYSYYYASRYYKKYYTG